MKREDIAPGQRLIWRRQFRAGYGYVIPVPCTVERVGASRVTILAELKAGGVKRVSVSPERLRVP